MTVAIPSKEPNPRLRGYHKVPASPNQVTMAKQYYHLKREILRTLIIGQPYEYQPGKGYTAERLMMTVLQMLRPCRRYFIRHQQHIGLILPQWRHQLPRSFLSCDQRTAARAAHIAFPCRLCPRPTVLRASERKLWQENYHAYHLHSLHYLHNGMRPGTQLAHLLGISFNLRYQCFMPDCRCRWGVCRYLW